MPGLHGDVLHELAVVAAGGGVSGRELARRLGASPEGVRRVLVELVRHGIVLTEEVPPARHYRINQAHLMYAPVHMLVGVRNQLFAWVASLVKEWEPEPLSVVAYGSAARGDGTTDSDIDLLIVGSDELEPGYYTWHSALGAQLLDQVSLWTGNRVELVEYQLHELQLRANRRDPLFRSIMGDAVTVFGTELDALLVRPGQVARE
jgi:predicted nucleotidyltransferase